MAEPLSNYVTKHILAVARGLAGFDTVAPGGIYKGVGPDNIPYPFMVFAYASGSDKLALNNSPSARVGGGMLYQLKAVDKATDDTKAVAAYSALSDALLEANGSAVSGALVYGQEQSPIDLPVTERDQLFQQIGAMWLFWVDPS